MFPLGPATMYWWWKIGDLFMEDGHWEEGWRNTSMTYASSSPLPHCPLQDKLVVTLRDKARQVIWMVLLLGYTLSICAAIVKTHAVGRRLVLLVTPAVLLLAFTCPVTSPLLQNSSALGALTATLVLIFEVACVVELLYVKPFGPAAALVTIILRLGTALALFHLKPGSSMASLPLLPHFGLAALAVFLLIVAYYFKTSPKREENQCSNTVIQRPLGLATRTSLPQATETLVMEQTLNVLRRDQKKNPSSTKKGYFQDQPVILRRSTRIRRPVERFDPSS
ncbi:uncharacterized protein [Dermacentor albipictus]|uniref:uncharacterized protein n=1 Tax=Dermacentor albipictus TaxID=60249 RepID=UPI0031FDDC88